MKVRVEAPARLHLGMLDLNGNLGRKFGSLGVSIAQPRTIVEAAPAPQLMVQGLERERAESFARRFLDLYQLEGGASITVRGAIPGHVGLGSGTQLALAIGAALARLYGLRVAPIELAQAMGRGGRSGIGIGAFDHGGFVLDAGQSLEQAASSHSSPPSIILHHPFPQDWFFVVILPAVPQGLSGAHEDNAFQHLPPPSEEQVGSICRLVLMKLMPALLEKNIYVFGEALTEVQRLVGAGFAPAQGSLYAHPILEQLIRRLLEFGALGAGQSSWGPAVYGLMEGEEAAVALADRMRAFVSKRGEGALASLEAEIFSVPANNVGHTIEVLDETIN